MNRPLAIALARLSTCLALAILPAAAIAQPRSATLTESLQRTWSLEPVSYPFNAPQGAVVPESVRVTGPAGPVAAQLTDVELWPNSPTLKSARLNFIVDQLAPGATSTYAFAWSQKIDDPAIKPNPAADLKITEADGKLEAVSARFGVRLRLGEKTFDTPANPADVPGPIDAFRLGDGTWFGGSRLFGETALKSWSAKVVARGPVVLRVEYLYTYADAATLKLAVQFHASGNQLFFDTDVSADKPNDGWDLLLTPGLPHELTFQFPRNSRPEEGVVTIPGTIWKAMPIKDQPAGKITSLSPWFGVWMAGSAPGELYLAFEGSTRQLAFLRRDAGAWSEPGPVSFFYGGGWQPKVIPLMKFEDGSLAMRVNNAKGQRKWAMAEEPDSKAKLSQYEGFTKGGPIFGRVPPLDTLKDWVLDWPENKNFPHPRLLLNDRDQNIAGKLRADIFNDLRDVEKLRAMLAALGDIDLLRSVYEVAARYDAIIDSGLLKPEERKLFRAQMAYLGYVVSAAETWSLENGYRSGNPNMSLTHSLNRGIVGLVLRDHPRSKAWTDYSTSVCQTVIKDYLGDDGYWLESSHYARHAMGCMIIYAIAAQRGGVADLLVEPRFKTMGLFYEKTLTPPDPLRRAAWGVPNKAEPFHPRVTPPWGRGTRGDTYANASLLARAYATIDPEYSAAMQWSWRQTGFAEMYVHHLAGLNSLYADRNLAATQPAWKSELFPRLGYLFRSHLGQPHENYLLFIARPPSSPDGEIWPADVGMLSKWFAGGTPIGGAFRRIPETAHVLLVPRVMLAGDWDPALKKSPVNAYKTTPTDRGAASLPGCDYADVLFDIELGRGWDWPVPPDAPAFPKRNTAGELPFKWRRQIMLASAEGASGPDYLVLRDAVAGGKPTQWHFWTLSEKIGTPDEAANRDAFLADKPGDKIAPARELAGNRFTALGQFDKDIEYFIAAPTDTPRHTLRYMTPGAAYGINNFNEAQDLLQLRLEKDGVYYVAIFPRGKSQAAPTFSTLADGAIIRIAGAFGTDFTFLREEAGEARAEGVAFKGTAGTVRDRPTGLELILAAPGEVRYRDFALAAPFPVHARIGLSAMQLTRSNPAAGGEVTFTSAEKWSLSPATKGVELTRKGDRCVLKFAPGIDAATLRR